jgi:hypothetical protein
MKFKEMSDRAEIHKKLAEEILTKMTDHEYTEADALTLLVGLTGKILSLSSGEQFEEKLDATCKAIKCCTGLYKDIYKNLKELTDGND